MHMSIWWGTDIGDFLFPGYKVKTVAALVATCLGVASLAFLFEWCKLLQAQHRHRQLAFRAKQIRSICPSESATLLDGTRNRRGTFKISATHRIGLPFFDAFLWIFMHNMGYLLMLTVMIYNGWIFIAVVLGSALGYFIFGQSFMKINLQNCQLIRNTFCMSNCAEPELTDDPKEGESTPTLQSTSATEIPSCHNKIPVVIHQQDSVSD